MGKLKIFPRTSNPRLSISMNMPDDIATWMLMNKKEYTEKMKLFQIIREGSLSELVSLMNTLKDAQSILNVKDDTGISPLHITSRFNKAEAAEILLQHGADPNISASRGSPLTVACRFKHEEVVKVLIKYGADPFLDVSSEGNVLHSIAIGSTVSIAEIVFKSIKAPVNSRSKLGRTPLHCVAHSGNEEICLWLLRHGADPKAKCNRMSTPMMIASKHGHVNIIRILIMSDKCSLNSVDHMLNEVDDEGNGPLHYAVLDTKTEAVQELLQLGCCPKLQNNHSMTPLHFCAIDGDVNLVTLLSSYLANLELKDLKGQTPLHKASEHNRLEVVEVLLQLGADIDAQDNKMYTPLMIACHKGYVELVKLLLKHGADTSKKNNLSQTCLQVATIRSQYDVVQVLLSLGDKSLLYGLDLFDQSALHQAAKLKDVKFINLLLEKGCSPTAFDALQETPLHIAAKNGSFETVKRLAEACSDVNCENYENKSPFFIACEMGNRKAMRALIQAGANVKDTKLKYDLRAQVSRYRGSGSGNSRPIRHSIMQHLSTFDPAFNQSFVRDMHLRNTLAVAAMNGYSDIVQDLIEMGVPLNCRDEEKNTALHHACSNGHVDTVKVLLDANASVTTTNLNDLSPLGMAVMQHKTDVVLAMIDHASWEESLSVRDKTGATCLDRMIANTPEGVKAVLDKCVRRSNHDPSQEDYKIEFNYKYIDPGPKDPMSKKNNYNAMATMMKYDREDLLSHDLCQSLMVYKWRRFGKAMFAFDSVLQMGFMVLMLLFYLSMTRPSDANYTCYATSSSNNTTLASWLILDRPIYTDYYFFTITYAIYGFGLFLISRELKSALLLGCRYLKTCSFWMTLTSIVFILMCVTPPGYGPCDQNWRLFAYGAFWFLIRESIMVQRFAAIGLYFTMFFEVFGTMLKVFTLMIFFGFALNIPLSLMMKQDGFREPAQGLSSILAMTIGELNFRDNFIKGDNSPFDIDLYILFPLFCIIMNLSLMNLMIGVAVGDISKVERRAYLTRLKTQIKYLLDAEVMPSMCIRQWMHTESVIVMPNNQPKSLFTRLKRAYDSGEQILYMKKKIKNDFPLDASVDFKHELEEQKVQINELNRLTRTALTMLNDLTQTLNRKDDSTHH